MNVLSVILLVAAIVSGAFGIVFVVEAVRKRDKKRSIAFSTASFFAAIVLALGSSYAAHTASHKGFTFHDYVWKTPSKRVKEVHVDASTMTAMLSGVGVAGA